MTKKDKTNWEADMALVWFGPDGSGLHWIRDRGWWEWERLRDGQLSREQNPRIGSPCFCAEAVGVRVRAEAAALHYHEHGRKSGGDRPAGACRYCGFFQSIKLNVKTLRYSWNMMFTASGCLFRHVFLDNAVYIDVFNWWEYCIFAQSIKLMNVINSIIYPTLHVITSYPSHWQNQETKEKSHWSWIRDWGYPCQQIHSFGTRGKLLVEMLCTFVGLLWLAWVI